ncbi:hypothetical protein [Hyphomicrobium sp. MC8b]|uniref:hypothetical protein n=1 Tax=Hyphomicrobium sp. MC8b TaxID=300273 RepID=UPI00391A2867
MKDDDFDEADLEALRSIKRQARGASYTERMEDEKRALEKFDGRRLRSGAPGQPPRAYQMNVRVRQEVKEMAHQIARKHRYTITEVIELSIEQFHAKTMKA